MFARWWRSFALVVVVLSATGCTALPVTPVAPAPPPSTRPALPTELPAYVPVDGETGIGTLSTQRGIADLGPFPVSSDRVAVYTDCIGEGAVRVEVAGVGSFENPCYRRLGFGGTRNEFDVRFVDEISVVITATDEQMWAITLTKPDE